jgi:tripartite-type tricarboxylate transporter receptor subunit TctC
MTSPSAKLAQIIYKIALVLSFFSYLGITSALAEYPDRPIRILVPFSPGGSTDLLARGLARHLSVHWKQAVLVENRPGAGGILAMRTAYEAPADGYTLVVHSDGFTIAPAIYSKLPYDVLNDFTPIALLARAPNVVVVGINSPYSTLKQLADAGKVLGKLSYASAGIGSAQHMQAAKFSSLAGLVEPVHIAYKGTPEGLAEVISGRVDFVFAPLSTAMPFLKDGKLKALAVSTPERSALLKEVPTLAEAGFPGYAEQQWWGLFISSSVPVNIIKKIESEVRAALITQDFKQLLKDLSSTSGDLFGKDLSRLIAAEVSANHVAAKAGNISAK